MLSWPRAFLRWPYAFAFCLSVAVGATTIYYSQHLDVGLKDPEGFLGPAYIRLPMIAILIFAVAIVPQAIYRYGFRKLVPGVRTIVRDEWNRIGRRAERARRRENGGNRETGNGG